MKRILFNGCIVQYFIDIKLFSDKRRQTTFLKWYIKQYKLLIYDYNIFLQIFRQDDMKKINNYTLNVFTICLHL